MNRTNIHIMSGLPGSGKSTFIINHAESWRDHISRDKVRDELRGLLGSTEYFPVSAEDEFDYWIQAIVRALPKCISGNFFIDQTTVSVGSAKKLIMALADEIHLEEYAIYIDVMKVPLDECLRRNAKRQGMACVPEDVIRKMSRNFRITETNIRKAITEAGRPDIAENIRVVYYERNDVDA